MYELVINMQEDSYYWCTLRLFQSFLKMSKSSFSYSEERQINAYTIDPLLHPPNPISTDFSETTPMSALAEAWGGRIPLFNNLQSCSISPSRITAQSQNKKELKCFFYEYDRTHEFHIFTWFSYWNLGFNFLKCFQTISSLLGCSNFLMPKFQII